MNAVMENMDDGKQPAILNEDLEGKHASYQEALQMAKDLHEQTRVSREGTAEQKTREIEDRSQKFDKKTSVRMSYLGTVVRESFPTNAALPKIMEWEKLLGENVTEAILKERALKVSKEFQTYLEGQATAATKDMRRLKKEYDTAKKASDDAEKAAKAAASNELTLGQEIKAMFKKETKAILEAGGELLDFVKKLKFAIGWGLPLTLKDIINPKLPGLAIICGPLGACLQNAVKIPKEIMKLVYGILKIPMKIIFIVIKRALSSLGVWKHVSVRVRSIMNETMSRVSAHAPPPPPPPPRATCTHTHTHLPRGRDARTSLLIQCVDVYAPAPARLLRTRPRSIPHLYVGATL